MSNTVMMTHTNPMTEKNLQSILPYRQIEVQALRSHSSPHSNDSPDFLFCPLTLLCVEFLQKTMRLLLNL